jgi:trehalose 6-phosphate synthase/phosphatase
MELASRLALVLDYDGTLVPFAAHPDQAAPDGELLDLLRTLSGRTGCTVHLVSGRTRENMEAWFGDLPLSLWGEHGLWRRTVSDEAWTRVPGISLEWMGRVRTLLDEFTRVTPGSFVEEKSSSLAWHYRMAAPAAGDAQAERLREKLSGALEGCPVHVLEGHAVLEVRPDAAHKGIPIRHLMSSLPSDVLIVVIGDDSTDDDMFRALPPSGISIHVGAATTAAQFRISDPAAVRSLLTVLSRLRDRDSRERPRAALDRGFQAS